MLVVLVGIINRTNWKKPNTQRGSFSITAQESEHTQQDKRGRTNTERPFFLRIVRKGKREYKNPQGKPEDKQGETKGNQTNEGQKDKMQVKR